MISVAPVLTHMTAQDDHNDSRHFTYRDVHPDEDLGQGNIVPKTSALARILAERCPKHVEGETTHVLVLTQSCDLARRGSRPCSAQTILVAPVSPIWGVIIDRITANQSEIERFAGICRQSFKGEIRMFLERLLNNNVEEHFYLHPDADVGIVTPSCAHIRLCFGLDAKGYYQHLRANRTVSLTESFGNKLGWHIAWLYARVGTEDWVPYHSSKEEFHEMISNLLSNAYPWMPDSKIAEARKELLQLPDNECAFPASPEEMREFIDLMPGRSAKDKALRSIHAVLTRSLSFDDDKIIQTVLSCLRQERPVKDLPEPEQFCQKIGEYLAQERLFCNDAIIDRIGNLLHSHDDLSALPDKRSVIENVRSRLGKIRLFDNKALTNKIYNLISGDPEFKDAMKEREP
ncbi:MAG: hypothetical protein AB1733_02525 [Thermodesulfobacteriota bacterium]